MVGTFTDPLSVSSSRPSITGTLDAPDADVADIDYHGGGPIYRDPASGMLLLFSHAERYLNPSFAGDQYFAWNGILKSTDGGDTWVDCGTILTPHHTFAEMVALYDTYGKSDGTRFAADIGWAPYVIVGDYFYVYYNNVDASIEDDRAIFGGGTQSNNMCVARAPVAAVVTAAAAATVTTWEKWTGTDWSEDGIRGTGAYLLPYAAAYGCAFSYNTFRQRYILLVAGQDIPDDDPDQKALLYMESEDGLEWTTPEVIGIDFPRTPDSLVYATIVDPTSAVPYRCGKSFYFIGKNFQDGEVMRWTITLTGAAARRPALSLLGVG
jgi:hypothetical protein